MLYATNGGTTANGYGFTVDGNGRVNIGLSTVATANAAADDLHLKSLGSNGITISSGNAQTGTIFFGDVDNSAVAGFRYNHNTGDMAISAEDNITFACDNVGIGTTGPAAKLHVLSTSTTEPTARIQSNGYTFLAGGANDPYHALILRGIPAAATTYAVTAGDQMSFLEYGGDFRFYEKNSLNSGTLNEISRIHKTD